MGKRRWRVVQTSDEWFHIENFKDYRFHWWARWIAWLYKGPSPSGHRHYVTRVEQIDNL